MPLSSYLPRYSIPLHTLILIDAPIITRISNAALSAKPDCPALLSPIVTTVLECILLYACLQNSSSTCHNANGSFSRGIAFHRGLSSALSSSVDIHDTTSNHMALGLPTRQLGQSITLPPFNCESVGECLACSALQIVRMRQRAFANSRVRDIKVGADD